MTDLEKKTNDLYASKWTDSSARPGERMNETRSEFFDFDFQKKNVAKDEVFA